MVFNKSGQKLNQKNVITDVYKNPFHLTLYARILVLGSLFSHSPSAFYLFSLICLGETWSIFDISRYVFPSWRRRIISFSISNLLNILNVVIVTVSSIDFSH